jgi:hypothetical protein
VTAEHDTIPPLPDFPRQTGISLYAFYSDTTNLFTWVNVTHCICLCRDWGGFRRTSKGGITTRLDIIIVVGRVGERHTQINFLHIVLAKKQVGTELSMSLSDFMGCGDPQAILFLLYPSPKWPVLLVLPVAVKRLMLKKRG